MLNRRSMSRWRGICLALAMFVAAPLLAAPPEVKPLAPETRLVAGRSQVIAFSSPQRPDTDIAVPCVSEDPSVVRVMVDGKILAGQDVGFVRVEALKPGQTTLRIGGATLLVRSAAAVVTPAVDAWPVRLVGPARGATVWGNVAIGVDLGVALRNAAAIKSIELLIGDKPVARVEPGLVPRPPVHHAVLEFNADALPAGPFALTPRATLADGRTFTGEAFPLLAAHVKPADVIAGECEASLANLFDAKENAKGSMVGNDADASGGKMVACYSADPMWGFEAEVPVAGMYQLMLVARGEPAAGAFPSVGVKLRPGIESESASRLIDYRWRRAPLGRAFKLAAGKQRVGVAYLNDFYAAGYADRNLYLDRYELARVEVPAAPAEGDGGAMMMAPAGGGGAPAPAKPAGDAMAMSGPAAPEGGAMMAMMMGGAAVDRSGAVASFDASRWLADASATPPLLIAFDEPLDGLEVVGDQLIQGYTIRTPASTPAPRVELLVNGSVAASQISPAPRFRLDPAWFKPGQNTLQMRATAATGTAVTQVHRVRVDPAILPGTRPLRYVYLHVADDSVWSENVRQARTAGWPKGHEYASFSGSAKAIATLPEDLEGECEVWLDCQAENAKTLEAKLALRVNDETKDFGKVEARGWLDEHKVTGKVTLARGPKRLVVGFDAPPADKGKEKKLLLRAVSVRQVRQADNTAPIAELLHPRDGEVIRDADVAVVRAADDWRLSFVDLVVDGQRMGFQADFYKHRGNALLPIAAGRLSPGEHTLSVRAADDAGNIGNSRTVRVIVAPPDPAAEPTRFQNAVALLNRFAYGPETRELSDLLTLGEAAWLRDRLDRLADSPGELESLARASMWFPDPYNADHVMQRSLHQAMLTDDPVRARFVFWLDNHFTTWIHKAEPQRKWAEHAAFFAIGPARFDELLLTSATSPAMLRYLDQHVSFETKLNENYARELMELHTVGVHAGYTQQDVTALAHVLNGWLATTEVSSSGRGFPLLGDFDFDPTLNGGRATRWFGVDLPAAPIADRYDRVRRVLETLAAHPAAANFICKKLVEHYAGYPASETLTLRLASVFHATGGDLREVLLAMAQDREFRALMHAPRVAMPMDYALRLGRLCGNVGGPGNLHEFLARCGHSLFNRITPDGYPQNDPMYADSNAMLQRWRLCRDIEWPLSTLAPRSLGWNKPLDPELWKQQVVDAYAIRLTGRLLGEASNRAALELLGKATGDGDAKLLQVAPFIASLPEASTR